jgi:ribose 5-phosphate isomerase RpiB
VWLRTEYEGGRHQRRLDKIATFENNGQCTGK